MAEDKPKRLNRVEQNEDAAKWYPVCVKPNAEKTASARLQSLDIEVYMPLKKALRQWSDRKKWVVEPLIRSYLFVRIRPGQKTTVLAARGVSRFVYFSGQAAVMPDRQIEQLKLLLATGAELELLDHVFARGEQVMIKAGPLKGLRGELVSFPSRRRFVLNIEYTGKSVAVEVPAAFLEPVK